MNNPVGKKLKHEHSWHLYNFVRAETVDVGEKYKQLVPARFNFVCSGCGETKHYPPIKPEILPKPCVKIEVPKVDFIQIIGIDRFGGNDWRSPLLDRDTCPIHIIKAPQKDLEL